MILQLTKIRTKLTALLLLSSLVATSIASGALSLYWVSLRLTALGDDLETTANALGKTCHATIAFNVPEETNRLLLTLKRKPTVVQARILAPETQTFAEYLRDGQPAVDAALPPPPYPARRVGWNSLEVVTEIVRDGERIGLFYVRDDMATIWSSLSALLLVIPLVVLGALGVTYAAMRRLQRGMTLPITALAETAAQVSQGRNYALRAEKQSPDEIGELTDAFNTMLGEIEAGNTALENYHNRLEALVQERTAALHQAQEQLVQKERLAVLGQLTATVSHELRNPMGSISNALFNLQLALEADRRDLVDSSLSVANRNVERCDRIIGELLDYSRKGKLVEREIEVDPWLQELLEEMIWPAQIRLHTDLRSGACFHGDGDRLRRAVLNVIINAQQALQDAEIPEKTVQVITRVVGDRLHIVIEDNGPGIPEELRGRIFEPLFSTKVYGIGLGMAAVEEIMRCHDGGVELHSPEGGGCRFILWIPFKTTHGAKNAD